MGTVQEHDAAIEVFLPSEGAWVEAQHHHKDPRGWVAYQVGTRVGIAPPEHWRPFPPEDGVQSG